MLQAQIFGIVRTLLAGLGGYFVAKGAVDQETATALAGAGATILVGVWSIVSKKKDAPEADK